MTYIQQCALKEAHDEHDWYDEDRDFAERHCWGKPVGQRQLELNHERRMPR